MSSQIIAKALGIKKKYLEGSNEVWALRGVDLEVHGGEFLALVGSSGCGKTTLLNLIGCLDYSTEGEIYVDGQKTNSLKSDDMAHLRAHKIGFIFQNFNLFPVLSVLENVEYPLIKRTDFSPSQKRKAALYYLEKVGLKDLVSRRPDQLSGGQRQRVAIARALVHNPRLVLADEPTANLDRKNALEILNLMAELNKNEGVTFIFSTHDPELMGLARRRIFLTDGQIVREEKS